MSTTAYTFSCFESCTHCRRTDWMDRRNLYFSNIALCVASHAAAR